MAEMGDIQRYLEDRYGSPRSLRNPLHEYYTEERRQPFPAAEAPSLPRAEVRNLGPRPGDALLAQNINEAVAARLGQDLAHRSYGNALLDALDLAIGIVPGAKGRGRGAKGSEGRTGKAAGAGAAAERLPDRGGVPGGERGLPASSGPLDPYTPVPGQPRVVKIPGHGEVEARPIPQIEQAARDYAAAAGRPYYVPEMMPPLDKERAARIAQAFEEMKHDPTDPAVRRAYNAMIEETLGQYQQLKNQGFDFIFNKGGVDPYAASPALGYLDMRDNGRLFVFPTIEGFGSGVKLSKEQLANNPLLQDSGYKFGDTPATANDIFRAVHDAYGHNGPGNPFFRAPGEERAWQHHSTMYGPEAVKGMTSETRGQNSWLNFGPYGERNRNASAADTVYADQKIGILPDWVFTEGRPPVREISTADVNERMKKKP